MTSPAQFKEQIRDCDLLEEQLAEAIVEPSTPLTKDDWDLVRQTLETEIASA